MMIKNNKAGFTLIEMLIAVSIFALVLITATNIYLIINNSQRKVVTLQKIQEDVRFLYEAVAQDIRLGNINYQFYVDNSINISTIRGGIDNNILALIDQTGTEIFYRQSPAGTEIQYCEISAINDCDLLVDSLWENITPEQVEIDYLKFVIMPAVDPYTEVTSGPTTCSSANHSLCDIGYYCTSSNECRYFSEGGNFHPKVIFGIKSRGIGAKIAEESVLSMQSIISTRIFPGQVENTNHD